MEMEKTETMMVPSKDNLHFDDQGVTIKLEDYIFSCRCTLKIEQNKEIYLALNGEVQSSNRISGLLKFPESTLRPALSKRGRPYLICKKTEKAMLELENCFKYMEINKVLESTSRILDIGQGQCFVWLISKLFQVLFSMLYYLQSYKRIF